MSSITAGRLCRKRSLPVLEVGSSNPVSLRVYVRLVKRNIYRIGRTV
ncbi:MAG: hypothetical protein JSC085_000865 [Candidatus Tokpelaia sp. JSC085]|nr:MAG: hypothetical protein JSC085_000865 [Candidatus Tokpelaia sp. JSC085]